MNWWWVSSTSSTVFIWIYVKWVQPGLRNPGWALPFHMAISHSVIVASYSAKRWCLECGSCVLFCSLSCGCAEGARHVGAYIWLWTWFGKRVIAVTEQRVQGYGRFFLSPCHNGCLLRICSEELFGWGTGAVHFGTKLLGIGVRENGSRIFKWTELPSNFSVGSCSLISNKYFKLKNSWGANGAPQTQTTC